jgi:hyperosmotically inducible protein
MLLSPRLFNDDISEPAKVAGMPLSDVQLRLDILLELEFDPSIKAEHIGVAVDRGVVTLSGHVESYAQKYAAIAATKRIKGVHAIADEMEIRYPEDKKTGDDEIARRATDILSWDVSVPKGTIQAVVRNGWVTLTGSVEWYFQKKAAEDDVRKLSGVRGIINAIGLKPPVYPDDVKKRIEDALRRHADVEAGRIEISIQDPGKVILQGNVESWQERRAVEDAAWSVPGVQEVVDKLTMT